MTIHMSNEIERLKKMLLSLCTRVEEQLWQAVQSIKNRDGQLAQKVIEQDYAQR